MPTRETTPSAREQELVELAYAYVLEHGLSDLSLRPLAARSISDWKNVYLDRCRECAERERCGGFFESSRDVHSRVIRAF